MVTERWAAPFRGALNVGLLGGALALGATGCTTTGKAGCAAGVCAAASSKSCDVAGSGRTNCGPSGMEVCCTADPVPGGTFLRGYDGVTPGYTSRNYAATVSAFQLDRYLVTVGRFRQFVAAVAGGWSPAAGDGKHGHLNGGAGLVDLAAGHEPGWNGAWTAALPKAATTWDANLACDPAFATWSPAPGASENLPITCVTWYEAYAFCIWDGGFLPSEAELNYVASGGGGGDGQRVYPWSTPPGQSAIDCTLASFTGDGGPGCGAAATPVGAKSPRGDGKWSQADLAGNVWEWTLDLVPTGGTYPLPCTDCTNTSGQDGATQRARRGGAFYEPAADLVASARSVYAPDMRSDATGVRCARQP